MRKEPLKIAFAALAALVVVSFSGCTTKIQVIDGGSEKSQSTKVSSGFNDETYIWESWTFSTNRVVK